MHRASTQLPLTSDEERELEEAFINRGVNSYVEVVDDENEDVRGEPNNRQCRVAESSNSHRRKNPKLSRIEKYETCMDKWSNTMEQLSGESISRQKYLELRTAKLEREQDISFSSGTSVFNDPYSIEMCMQILNGMESLSTQSYTKATKAFFKPGLREIFMKIPSNKRAEWLDFLNLEHEYIDRMPCQTSSLTGRMCIQEILDGHPQVCFDNFRMSKHVFVNFYSTLKEMNLLQDGKKVTVEEGVAIFLYVQIDFNIHSTPVASGSYEFYELTHVSAWAPSSIQTSFCSRKVIVTQNVMLACDFNMLSTFVYTGWEGTTNDSRVFIDALTKHKNNFPKPCDDQFYLVDSGYPNMSGFLAPYRGQRYHLRDYRGQGKPRGKEDSIIGPGSIPVAKNKKSLLEVASMNIAEFHYCSTTVSNLLKDENACLKECENFD
ncbi:hypothetical protein ZIOFF_018613 [Zingiber officinale]|uniref:DDE Tnp4 domain-containing protein n=1 Tax=Zingiber officinale TaxID=94328 RepID=A0A8J5HQJ6_ZINOF|nr:hypothetical protein ZIOFF_018613 [Zingiber officinale]